MSVNDPLPWIEPACGLVRAWVERGVPLLGHCLGGQLMAKALGAQVTRNRSREFGWGEVQIEHAEEARRWFGAGPRHDVFHWHGETFSLPPGAVRLLSSALCANQAFVLGNRHLALQCHVEMTAELIETWCRSGADEIAAHPGRGVQSVDEMQCALDVRLAALHRLAERIYGQWMKGLAF
jgi:GMP synthase-like glutamine amidotransferase